jgi:hypothetical protein
LIETLPVLPKSKLDRIRVDRLLEMAEWCSGEGELLHFLVFLKIACRPAKRRWRFTGAGAKKPANRRCRDVTP